jgi:hypothetical protein
MLCKPVQPLKALKPIVLTLSGMIMLVKLLQPAKANLPISVTLLGIEMLFKLVQPSKADLPIVVTGKPFIIGGITIFSSVPTYFVI